MVPAAIPFLPPLTPPPSLVPVRSPFSASSADGRRREALGARRYVTRHTREDAPPSPRGPTRPFWLRRPTRAESPTLPGDRCRELIGRRRPKARGPTPPGAREGRPPARAPTRRRRCARTAGDGYVWNATLDIVRLYCEPCSVRKFQFPGL